MKRLLATGVSAGIALIVMTMAFAGVASASGPTHPIPTSTCSGTLVLSASYHVVNDEDSGFVGYWALDHYAKTVQVWETAPGAYCAYETYDGGWHTYEGALSPANGVAESHSASGNFNGYLVLTFTATSVASVFGHLPTKNYGGTASDIQLGSYAAGQTGDPSVFSWTSAWVVGYGHGAEPSWGFYYYIGNTLSWTNAASGSSGDIVV